MMNKKILIGLILVLILGSVFAISVGQVLTQTQVDNANITKSSLEPHLYNFINIMTVFC